MDSATGHEALILAKQIHAKVEQASLQQVDTRAIVAQQLRKVEHINEAITNLGHDVQQRDQSLQSDITRIIQINKTVNARVKQLSEAVINMQTGFLRLTEQISVTHTTQVKSTRKNLLAIEKTPTMSRSPSGQLTRSHFQPTSRSNSLIHAEPEPVQQQWQITRCACPCHKVIRASTPSSLRKILGIVSLYLRGNAIRSCICAARRCKNRGDGRRLLISYTFPTSWAEKMLSFTFSRAAYGDPSAKITSYNITSLESLSFSYVSDGEIDRLKEMFIAGTARPTDIDEYGDSLLYVSFP